MSGIFGVWNLDGRPVERTLLERLGGVLAHRGPDERRLFVDGPAGLGCRLLRVTPESLLESQPVVGPAGVVVVFDGRLDNREELIGVLRDRHDVSVRSSDPDLVAALYEAYGGDFAAHLTGDFALAVFDPRAGRLMLVRDAIGVRPLYYRHESRFIVFASEIKAILAHPEVTRRPNDAALAGFLLCRSHLQDDDGSTFFGGIRSVPPSHLAVVSSSHCSIRRYWDFDPGRHPRVRSFEESAEAFRYHFVRSVRRRIRSLSPVAVSVSGGLDSSSILCVTKTLDEREAARETTPTVRGFTYTRCDSSCADESEFVADIERHLGIHIDRIDTGLPGLLHGVRDVVWHAESPLLDGQWNRTARFFEAIRDSGARVLLTGHWGDQVLFDPAYLIDLFHGFSWRAIRAHLKEYPRWFADARPHWFERQFFVSLLEHDMPRLRNGLQVFRGLLRRRLSPAGFYSDRFRRQAAGATLRREFGREAGATVYARSLYRDVRSRFNVLCLEWNNKVGSLFGFEMAFPFLDRDLLEFLMSVPGEFVTHRGVPKAILREALQGIVPDRILRRSWKADFTHIVNDGARRDYPALIPYLGPDALVVQSGYVNTHALPAALAEARRRMDGPIGTSTRDLARLLGLELWLRLFVGDLEQGQEEKYAEATVTRC